VVALYGFGLALPVARALAFDPPAFDHLCADSTDAALCERLTYIANAEYVTASAIDAGLQIQGNVGVHGDGGQAVLVQPDNQANPWPVTSSGETSVAGTVALAEGDAQRLDLIWWGIWLAAGLSIGFWVGGRAWRHYKGWG
jgi:hypothetical protein